MKILLVLTLSIVTGGIAYSQCDASPNQLVPNCAFDSNIGSWGGGTGTLSHNSSIGYNAPGSMQCDGVIAGAWVWCTPRLCIPVSPSTTYGAGFRVVLTTPPTNMGSYPPFYEVRYYYWTDSSCTTTMSGLSHVASGSGGQLSDTAWHLSQGDIVTDTWVNGVTMEVRVLNQGGNTANDLFTAHYDDVFLGIGLVPVELQSVSVE